MSARDFEVPCGVCVCRGGSRVADRAFHGAGVLGTSFCDCGRVVHDNLLLSTWVLPHGVPPWRYLAMNWITLDCCCCFWCFLHTMPARRWGWIKGNSPPINRCDASRTSMPVRQESA